MLTIRASIAETYDEVGNALGRAIAERQKNNP
jgi:hypothetical protein